ncbi:PRC-barrel domain containing protein, partial [bacterium]|nr:PRC-barrel domain containing protein [bacterium]
MLREITPLIGYKIEALDGEIGTVKDFLFDDATWDIRYMVADTGKWLPGRKVLLHPVTLKKPNWTYKEFPVNLTKKLIEESPPIDADEPVSRTKEKELFLHYSWTPYWPAENIEALDVEDPEEKPGPHLRSFNEVKNYAIHAMDGRFGHLADCVVDDMPWMIRYLIIDTVNWLPSKKVLFSPMWVKSIDWDLKEMQMPYGQEIIKSGPEYDPEKPITREYESQLFNHYGE